MPGPKKDPSSIRYTGKRGPNIPEWASQLLSVIAKRRGKSKHEVMSDALAQYATDEELDEAEKLKSSKD